MVYVVSNASAAIGKQKEARELAIKVAEYWKQHFKPISIEVLQNIHGPLNRIHWVAKWDSMAAAEKAIESAAGDSEAQSLGAGYSSCFEGPVERSYYQIL